MTSLHQPPSMIYAPTSNGDSFAVRRVFCVGQNYAAHAREMGAVPTPEEPFFFTKWAETVVPSGTEIAYPAGTSNYHFEGELVVAIGTGGSDIRAEDALAHVYGYAAGLDMTRRDLQAIAKQRGRPWDFGKNVEQSSPLGLIHPASLCGHLSSGSIQLFQNGELRQDGDLADLINPVPALIVYLSAYYHLEAGDLLYTGTPAGVGAVEKGDLLAVRIEGLSPLEIRIGAPRAS